MKSQFILTPYYLDQPLPTLEESAEPDWQINHQPLPEADVQSRMSVLHGTLAHQVTAALAADHLPVSIAGDCCATIGVMAGLQRGGIKPLLIWFDAHGDFNTWETTPSNFLGGMPLAMLAGLGEQTMLQALDLHPVAQERIVLTDGRDLDPGEQELIAGSEVVHLGDPLQLLDYPLGERPLYIHFDTDIINPLDVPAVNYVATGGPRAMALAQVFRHLAQTEQIVAVSLSTWNPKLDADGRSKELCMSLLQALLGETHQG
jgi:arginase